MTGAQFEAILAAIADVQTSTDALGLDMNRVLEILARTSGCPQPPEWVNNGDE